MTTEQDVRDKIVEAKVKLSKLDVELSRIRGVSNHYSMHEEQLPVEGQPFTYIFRDPLDNQAGIRVPAGESGFFSGIMNVDSDSSFVCTDLQGVQQVYWTNENDLILDPDPGTYFSPLCRSDGGFRFFLPPIIGTSRWGVEFGFRFTDTGTGRRLDQVQDSNNAELYLPSKFLGCGLPFSEFGPNYKMPLPFDSVFAKNTSVKLDINVVSPFEDEVRIWVGLIGYKVFGD